MREEDDFMLLPYERPVGVSRQDLDQMLSQFMARGGAVMKLEMGDSYFMPKKVKRGRTTPARALRR